ncbi:hypothetical protein VNO78_10383 [Psophocarpus tetragonolobus]|uniref:Uncharacterized protein n=1 Tax=Psophocarpus tetragonolobus TaxID=3891 RepID=A0AAN9XMP7_PSOTE
MSFIPKRLKITWRLLMCKFFYVKYMEKKATPGKEKLGTAIATSIVIPPTKVSALVFEDTRHVKVAITRPQDVSHFSCRNGKASVALCSSSALFTVHSPYRLLSWAKDDT